MKLTRVFYDFRQKQIGSATRQKIFSRALKEKNFKD
jgi:hypothetical protein